MAPGRSVGDFFDGQAADYDHERVGMQPFHRITARKIEEELSGQVLSVGGLWFAAKTDNTRFSVTIVDLSAKMLAARVRGREALVRADARYLPFRKGQFDHVVMPLILHHIAGRSGGQARAGVRAALAESMAVLRPGGRLWINEFCVPEVIYAAELIAAPLTCRLLGLVRTPLVVMHSLRFYARALESLGFSDVRFETIRSPDTRPTDLIRPILGLPFFKVPRAVYPVVPTLIRATVPT